MCSACGENTPRANLCKQCSLLDELDDVQESAPEPDVLEYECTACGENYRTDGSQPCPACGARRRRYAGDLDPAVAGGDAQ